MNLEYLKKKKILIVDDEPELLQMAVSILKEEGYEHIATASCVSDGLKKAQEWVPEFAVLDVMLPDGSGFELLSQLRKERDFPVLFLSARGEDEDRLEGLSLGADDYMVKPFLPKELLFRRLLPASHEVDAKTPARDGVNGCGHTGDDCRRDVYKRQRWWLRRTAYRREPVKRQIIPALRSQWGQSPCRDAQGSSRWM